jgi:hypothetical protein
MLAASRFPIPLSSVRVVPDDSTAAAISMAALAIRRSSARISATRSAARLRSVFGAGRRGRIWRRISAARSAVRPRAARGHVQWKHPDSGGEFGGHVGHVDAVGVQPPGQWGVQAGCAFDADCDHVLTMQARRGRLDSAIEDMAADGEFTPIVRSVSCLRVVSTLTGFALDVENR